MMVVAVRGAPAVEGLAVVPAQHVDLAPVHQHLQVPVDGGQPDGLALLAQPGVQVLGAGERVGGGERGRDGIPLPGGPEGGAAAGSLPAGGGGAGGGRRARRTGGPGARPGGAFRYPV
jgi:hypothetical protein